MPPQRRTAKPARVPATKRAPKAPKSEPIAGFFIPQSVCQEAVDVIADLLKLTPEPLAAMLNTNADALTRKLLSLQPVSELRPVGGKS